jgi:manganese/zinc/iron transport system permease protein
MLGLAAVFGLLAGLLGAFLSFLGNRLPTGPFIVLGATAVFFLAFLFGPRHGLLPRLWVRLRRDQQVALENLLKAVFHVRESRDFTEAGVTVAEIAQRRNEPWTMVASGAERLVRRGFASWDAEQERSAYTQEKRLFLTPRGWETACRIVRNHRLWELYLTHAAHYQVDHVHDDAEVIEHVLGDDVVRQVERRLDFPVRDPHGKLIPGQADMQRGFVDHPSSDPSREHAS